MKDIEIINQLLNGNYLSEKELSRAKGLLESIRIEIHNREDCIQ